MLLQLSVNYSFLLLSSSMYEYITDIFICYKHLESFAFLFSHELNFYFAWVSNSRTGGLQSKFIKICLNFFSKKTIYFTLHFKFPPAVHTIPEIWNRAFQRFLPNFMQALKENTKDEWVITQQRSIYCKAPFPHKKFTFKNQLKIMFHR